MAKVTQQAAESTATGTVPDSLDLDWHREGGISMLRAAQRLIRTAIGANEAALAIGYIPEETEHRRVRRALGQAMENLMGVGGVLESLEGVCKAAEAAKKTARAKP